MQNRMIAQTMALTVGYLTLGAGLLWAVAPSLTADSAPRASHTVTLHSRVGLASSQETAGAASSSSSPRLYRPNYASFANTLRHWDKAVLTVYVDAASNGGKTVDQTTALVAQSMALWNEKLGAAIHLQPTTDADNADIKLSFVPSGSLEGGAIGRTDVNFRLEDQILTRATVRINEDLPSNELVQVAAHELGHALGIQGHSNDKRDLMYPYAHLPAEITDRDFNTMAVSYPTAITTSATANADKPHATGVSSDSDSAAEFPRVP